MTAEPSTSSGWPAPTGIYGGTLEVFRNMIAQHALGLGRPNYSPPAKRKS